MGSFLLCLEITEKARGYFENYEDVFYKFYLFRLQSHFFDFLDEKLESIQRDDHYSDSLNCQVDWS